MTSRTLGASLRAARKNRQWTQAQLAKQVQISGGRLSQFETDRRYPSEAEWERFRECLDLGPYQSLAGPSMPWPLKNWKTLAPPLTHIQDRSLASRHAAARKRFGLLVDATRANVACRPSALVSQRFLQRVSLDSGHEYWFWLRLLAMGGRACWYGPAKAGFRRLEIVDRSSLENVSDLRHPCVELERVSYQALFFPQVTIDTRKAFYRLDALVCLRRGYRRVWIDLEIDGEGHRHDLEFDLNRQRLLELETLRLNPQDLAAPDFASLLDSKLQPFLAEPRTG